MECEALLTRYCCTMLFFQYSGHAPLLWCLIMPTEAIDQIRTHMYVYKTTCRATELEGLGIHNMMMKINVSFLNWGMFSAFPSIIKLYWLHSLCILCSCLIIENYNLIIMKLGQNFVCTNLRNWPKNLQQTRSKLLSAVRGVTPTGISIVSLRNESFSTFCLCLTTGRGMSLTVCHYSGSLPKSHVSAIYNKNLFSRW